MKGKKLVHRDCCMPRRGTCHSFKIVSLLFPSPFLTFIMLRDDMYSVINIYPCFPRFSLFTSFFRVSRIKMLGICFTQQQFASISLLSLYDFSFSLVILKILFCNIQETKMHNLRKLKLVFIFSYE